MATPRGGTRTGDAFGISVWTTAGARVGRTLVVDLVQSIGLGLLAAAQILAVRHSRWRGVLDE